MTEVATETKSVEVEKLYAGKYKTAEEMETAIIGKDQEYGRLRQTHEDLKKTHDINNVVPESYVVPVGSEIIKDEIAALQEAAKIAQLPQEKFDRISRELIQKKQNELAALDAKRKEVGDANIVILEDYVKKAYPPSVQKTVLDQLITDPAARDEALKHRDKLLNNRAPGMDNGNPGGQAPKEAYDGQKEMQDLAKRYESNKHDKKLRDKMIETAREVGEQRFKKG